VKFKRLLIFLTVVSVLGFSSCHKGTFSVSQTLVQPYIICEENQDGTSGDKSVVWSMGLSLYVHAFVPSENGLQMILTDPSGYLSWSFTPSSTTYDGVTYYGSSNIAMPSGALLPQGTWSLEILYKDGRTLELSFDVSYNSIDEALRLSSSLPATEKPFFDATSNLTIF